MNNLIGKYVKTINGHSGIVIKQYKVTGRGLSVYIKENNGLIYYCPISYIEKVDKYEEIK